MLYFSFKMAQIVFFFKNSYKGTKRNCLMVKKMVVLDFYGNFIFEKFISLKIYVIIVVNVLEKQLFVKYLIDLSAILLPVEIASASNICAVSRFYFMQLIFCQLFPVLELQFSNQVLAGCVKTCLQMSEVYRNQWVELVNRFSLYMWLGFQQILLGSFIR